MPSRLRQLVAWWFVLQIVVPFTAPLQTLELRDLFGATHHHSTTSSPESTTTPTISEASPAMAMVSVLTSTTLRGATAAAIVIEGSMRGSATSARHLLPAPQVQRSVLRL
ncbi:MAG TPA: hypothetical protein VLV86_23800 [Vicinamibacterales bacterium]|nr:hypothetical protein [Vicinamibacterales bacterium]